TGVTHLVRTIQEVINQQNYPYPVWLFGGSATFGVRFGYEHDIDLAFPFRWDSQNENFIGALIRHLSASSKSYNRPLIPERFPIRCFLLPESKDGLVPFLRKENKFVFRVTSDSIATFTRETISDLYRAAHADLERYVYSLPGGQKIRQDNVSLYLPEATAAIGDINIKASAPTHTSISTRFGEQVPGARASEDEFALFTASLAELHAIAEGENLIPTSGVGIGLTGQSLILCADDMLERGAFVDFEDTMREMASILEGGKIIIHAEKEENAAVLGAMIKRADSRIETETLIRKGAGLDELIRFAYSKGVRPKSILAIVKGRVKDPFNILNVLSSNETCLVTMDGEEGIYFLRPALKRAAQRKKCAGQEKSKKDWIIPLRPAKPLSEEFEAQYRDYLNSLLTLQNA
ncbi:MAG: hypothetical protein JW994_08050, partial [Candidatus Omnitrophica bacterium]|nr:hypothetical protein [Candidatus Omnitrophota bacterium]